MRVMVVKEKKLMKYLRLPLLLLLLIRMPTMMIIMMTATETQDLRPLSAN